MSKNIRIFFMLSICLFVLSACKPPSGEINQLVKNTINAFTPIPSFTPFSTHTAYPSLTPNPTYTPWIQTKIVTQTFTPTPEFTSTITNTPTITPTITNTPDPLKAKKGPGFYLVGDDIAPGSWRSQGESNTCYWSITSKTGKIIDNHFGLAGGTMYIFPNAYQVELNFECGDWEYLGN
jgi:hypothetical protein